MYVRPKTLLSDHNSKTIKGEAFGIKTFILSMSPHKLNSSGKNVCPKATPGCSAACLFYAGRGKFVNVQNARQNRTEYFLRERDIFLRHLVAEITLLSVRYGNLAIRLNGTSDLPYENIKIEGKTIFEIFPEIQFYDYTKDEQRFFKPLPKNYFLAYSISELEESKVHASLLLSLGFSVAAVFRKRPAYYLGFPVADGDKHDLIYIHQNKVIGLSAKGRAKYDKTGFVI
jgi:hypothetical protein